MPPEQELDDGEPPIERIGNVGYCRECREELHGHLAMVWHVLWHHSWLARRLEPIRERPIRCRLGLHQGYVRPNYCSDEIGAERGIHFHCTNCGDDISRSRIEPPP